ncbi:MAG: glycosyltransferase [Anaerolineales bacterium]|nr:glycosyltransferase [Anaerolineales bacterium]
MKTRKRVCILVFSDIARDGRVLRQVEYARRSYEVDVVAYGQWNPPEGVAYFQLDRPVSASFGENIARLFSLARGRFQPVLFERVFWRQTEHKHALEVLQHKQYDLIHANDWMALPVAACATQGKGTRLLFDAHEYTPAQFDQYFTGRHLKSYYYEYMLRAYAGKINEVVTVSDGIANLYRENFGWESTVVRNAPAYTAVEFHATDPNSIQLVHHGGASPGRHLEDLIHLMTLLDERFHLTFILVPTRVGYVTYLKKLAMRLAPCRIRFIDAVPPSLLTSNLTMYDVGIHLLKAANLNYLYALPNKLFDFIMAGLGVAIFPLPEMAKLVKEHGIGIVSMQQSIRVMANSLNTLSSAQIDEFKKNSLLLAKTLHGDAEMAKLMDIYARLLSA